MAGVAYKRDIDDMRESPALDVMGRLHACTVASGRGDSTSRQ
jgi:UDP-N-acetyl-D-mannosaminuronate dehydrogenase